MLLKKLAQKAYLQLAPKYSDLEEVQLLNLFQELNQTRVIQFGIPQIDQLLTKKYNRGSIFSIVHDTLSGASSTLMALSRNALINDRKLKVLYIDFDLNYNLFERALGSLASVESRNVLPEIKNDKSKVASVAQEFNEQFILDRVSNRMSTMDFLAQYLEFYKKYPFDLLVIDNPYFTISENHFGTLESGDDQYTRLGDYRGIRAIHELTQKTNCMTILSSRMSRENGRVISDVAMRSNNLLSISKISHSKLKFNLMKHRELSNVTFDLDMDFSIPQLPFFKTEKIPVMIQNQSIIYFSKKYLENIGVNVKMTELYELFSKLNGEKSWNVANSKNTSFFEMFDQKSLLHPDDYQLLRYCENVVKNNTNPKN